MNGNHDFVASEVDSQSIKLRQQITETWTEGGFDPYLTVKLPFFNEGESFEIQIFFDGKTDQCSVYCRMEDVSVRMKSLGYGDVIGVAGVLLGLIPIVGGVGEAGAKLLSKSIGRTKRR